MNPADALREQVRAFVDGRITLQALCTWLGGHVDEVEASGDPAAEDIAGEIWGLSSELGYGHRTLEEVRAQLAALVAPPGPTLPSWVSRATTGAGEGGVTVVSTTTFEPVARRVVSWWGQELQFGTTGAAPPL